MAETPRQLRPGDNADVRPGELFEVRLTTARSEGRRLSLHLPAEVTLVDTRATPGAGFGARGQAVYLFRCTAEGNFAIVFHQSRPWVGDDQAATLWLRCAS